MTRRSARQIRVDELVANPANIRDDVGDVSEISRSIKQHGILQPLTVTEDPKYRGWLVLAGHRRLAGARQAGLKAVPCFIHHEIGTDTTEHTVLMLVENVQRRNLSPMEKARAYGRLRDTGLTPTDIARRTGIAVSSVHTHLSLLDVDEDTAERVEEGTVTAGAAIAAVREHRQAERKKAGTPVRGRPVVIEPAWLSSTHPLAAAAAARCGHTSRPRFPIYGDVRACGQCWETAVREDALRTGSAELPTPQPTPQPTKPYDEVAVARALNSDPPPNSPQARPDRGGPSCS